MPDLRKIQAIIEDFCTTIFQLFQFNPEQKKTCGNESHELNMFTLQLTIYYILIGNLDWCKCGH